MFSYTLRLFFLSTEIDDLAPRRRRRFDAAGEEQVEVEVDIDSFVGRVEDFLSQEAVQRTVEKKFRTFLKTYTASPEDPTCIYQERLKEAIRANKRTLEVSYVHTALVLPTIGLWLADHPRSLLTIFHRCARQVAQELFPGNDEMIKDIWVRITELPICDSLRDIRQVHLGTLIRVPGVVTRRTAVFPQLLEVNFDCVKCGYMIGPFMQNDVETEVRPLACPACQSRGPFNLNSERTVYRNYQKITLQEAPGSVPAGRLPRSKEIVLLNDLIDAARPGEEIEVTGVFVHSYDAALNVRNGFPVFNTVIEANHVQRKEDRYGAQRITDEDRAEILGLRLVPDLPRRIVKSMAPSIYGHENVKMAVALALFGGQEKVNGKHRLRGDINVLLLGDPGMAKSQILKYIEKTAPRAVYTTGKGASAVGLTAAVHRDPVTREWTLEGGALVLADRGVCLIDEFDKMNDQDRVSIHEAMEQQSISISKAGIVTQLQARCSVIAAANPINGRYETSKSFSENVELSDPILSRFDILCVIKDTVDPILDERLASFVVDSHARCSAAAAAAVAGTDHVAQGADHTVDHDAIPQELLKKYIAYAREHVKPRLSTEFHDKIAQVYAELRKESLISAGMPIAVRHLESMIRMSESHAKMHLREQVHQEDVDVAIRIMLESFVSTQKAGVQRSLQRKFARYLRTEGDYDDLLLYVLRQCVRDELRLQAYRQEAQPDLEEGTVAISKRDFTDRVQEHGVQAPEAFFASERFRSHGFSLDEEGEKILYRAAE